MTNPFTMPQRVGQATISAGRLGEANASIQQSAGRGGKFELCGVNEEVFALVSIKALAFLLQARELHQQLLEAHH